MTVLGGVKYQAFVMYRVVSGNSYKKIITRLTTLLFSFKISDYGATIVQLYSNF